MARLDEMEVTLGMIDEEFIIEADCRQPMLKPIAGILKKELSVYGKPQCQIERNLLLLLYLA